MLCCLNPDCESPINPDGHIHCQNCGIPLVNLLYNRFKIIQPIGRGGFGKTYLAEDVDNLNGRCVVKQLAYQGQSTWATKKAVELFEQEAKQLQKLGVHPQIPTLLAYFQDGSYLYLVQQFIEGEDLLKQLEQQGQYSEAQIQQLLIELLPVLQFIHDRDVIHRDIKPANIMRDVKDSRLFLIDFGVSKLISRSVVGTASILGSYGYSPLEQIQQGKVVYASDLYALGATCFHLLSGVPPHQIWSELGYGWANDWRNYLSKPITSQLGLVLDKLLQKEVQNRYQSAKEVLKDLQSPTTVINPPSPLTELPGSPNSSILGKKRWLKTPAVLIGSGLAAITAISMAIGIPYLLPHPHSTTSEVAELYKRAGDKFAKGNKQEALDDLTNAIALDPNYADAYINRGYVRSTLGNAQGAIEDYNIAIEIDPNDFKPYIYRGDVRAALGDKENAIADYTKGIELNPQYIPTYHARAFVRLSLGDAKGMIEDYTKAIEIDPTNFLTYDLRGVARSNLNDNQGALEDLNKSIELNRINHIGYNDRGLVHQRLGNLQKALDDFNQAIKIKPDLAVAYSNRSIVRMGLGDFQGAIEDNTKAIARDAKSFLAYNNRGFSRLQLGDNKGAIEDYNKAIDLKPDFDQAYTYRAVARAALGDKKGAIEDYHKAADFYLQAKRTKDYNDTLYRIRLLQKQ
jgi:serine/threonine protein kinase